MKRSVVAYGLALVVLGTLFYAVSSEVINSIIGSPTVAWALTVVLGPGANAMILVLELVSVGAIAAGFLTITYGVAGRRQEANTN